MKMQPRDPATTSTSGCGLVLQAHCPAGSAVLYVQFGPSAASPRSNYQSRPSADVWTSKILESRQMPRGDAGSCTATVMLYGGAIGLRMPRFGANHGTRLPKQNVSVQNSSGDGKLWKISTGTRVMLSRFRCMLVPIPLLLPHVSIVRSGAKDVAFHQVLLSRRARAALSLRIVG